MTVKKEIKLCKQQNITTLGGKYYFCEKSANKAKCFIESLRHTKSPFTGNPFILLPWQTTIMNNLFGWKRADDKTRRFRRMYLQVAKKNGKSTLCAAIALYLLLADNEYGAEVYSAATDRAQAKIVFSEAKSLLKFSPYKKLVSPYPTKESTKVLLFPSTGGKYTTVSSDTKGQHGLNISGLIFDELHALLDSALYSTLTEGSGASRSQPLHVSITTAGYSKTSVCFSEYESAKKVIENEKFDEELYGIIYEVDAKDDWTDPAVWIKANPSLGVTPTLRNMQHDCEVAQKQASKQNEFKRLRLDMWTSQLTRWLDGSVWDAAGREYGLEDLRGLSGFGGVDLSSTKDLTCFCLAVPKDEGVYLWPYIFLPEMKIEENSKRDHVPYDRWVADGFIFATPGNVVDYDFIIAKMEEAQAFMDLQSVQFDAWRAAQVAAAAEKCNIKMIPVPQSPAGMGAPCVEFERLLTSGRLFHPKNPCMTWAANNIEVRTTYGGLITPNKPAETHGQQKRIDPIVAAILALERIARGVKPESTDSQHIRSL